MKIHGGYTPKIAGKPKSIVEELPLPGVLQLNLERGGLSYKPIVKNGQKVEFGDSLAEASLNGGTLLLPSPASGKVTLIQNNGKKSLALEVSDASIITGKYEKFQPQRITAEKMRQALAKGGIWPLFWSSRTGEIPPLTETRLPKAIIVNCILTEPFRARGKVILRRSWNRIVAGIRFLPRLLVDYGTIQIILTARHDPVARMMYVDLAGHAWVRFHSVPLLYPIENPRILSQAIRKSDSSFKKDDVIWAIDVQGVEALGACLAEGLPLYQRVVAAGGPGHSSPKHLCVRIGTPVTALMSEDNKPGGGKPPESLILRGGLFRGEPVDSVTGAVQYDDDAFFFLPSAAERQFISFLRPGFDRTSYLPCFASRITGAPDRHISTMQRGEKRPCIACGLCESACPARLIPQVLHRYLYRESLDEAEKAGLNLCVNCGLCTYICPSKIELQQQFLEAREQIRLEHEEIAAAASSKSEKNENSI